MKTILEIIGISCFAVLFAEASGIMQWVKRIIAGKRIFKFNGYMMTEAQAKSRKMHLPNAMLKRLKPLDCPMCLAWWLGLIYFGITLQSIQAIIYAATCSILAIIISKLLIKLI